MISSSTRASRSRYSSPAQPLENSRGLPNESSRSFMQRWLEPSVQSKASFEEAGLMRHGVLESMAPLGTLPKPKKAGNENGQQQQQPQQQQQHQPQQQHEKQHQPVRKIILRPSGTQPPSDDAETSAPKTKHRVPSPPAPSSSPPPTSAPTIRRVIITRDTVDGDYAPKEATARGAGAGAGERTSAGAPAATEAATEAGTGEGLGASLRRRQSRRVSLPASKPKPATTEHTTKPAIRAKPATPPKRVRRREPMDREFADKVVEAAVEEALKHNRYPTAWALRTLYDEKSGDADFVAMVEDVFKQTADAETMEEFCKLIEDKKREGKQDNQGCYYFVPPTTNNRFTPHKPRLAPYGKLLIRRPQSQEEKSEGRATKKVKVLHSTSDSPRDKKLANGAKGHHHSGNIRTPSRRRTRRGSGSSESSLSSAMSLSSPDGTEDDRSPSRRKKKKHIAIVAIAGNEHDHENDNGNDGDDDDDDGPGDGVGRSGGSGGIGAATASAPLTGGGRSQSDDAPNSRPITSTRRKALVSTKQAKSNASEPTSPTNIYPSRARTSSSKADANMPGKVASSNLVVGTPKESANGSNDQEVASVIKSHMLVDDEKDPFWTRRREAQKITNGFVAQESSMRDGEEDQEATSTPARKTRRTRHSLIAPITTRSTRSTSKKRPPNEEGDLTVSPLAFSFNEGSSTVGSRAATPTTMRPVKKPRIGLRIKSSPIKKRGGTAAGVPRSMSEAQSVSASVSAGTPREQGSDNDEYCSACGNAGDVVCCDGCPRSFHFECVDMVQSDNLPDEWYCNECFAGRYPSRVPIYKGAFASALNYLEKSIPRAFSLPKRLQNRFEGVKAGADGDYEDITTSKIVRKRPGYDELPDFFKQREDGEAILCHACQKPATEIRAIIPCNACPFHWHIDCLDPPLAMPPVLKTWRCPAHVDDMLTETPPLAPAHRYRRIRGGQLIIPAFSRGTKNNGHIEIDWADEPDRPSNSGWKDPESFGRTYRLPAQGVILDFIEQLRQQGAGYGSRSDESRWVPYSSPRIYASGMPTHGSSLERRVDEMQVSLTLMGLKQRRSENIDQLTSALLTAADDNVLALMAKGNADNFAQGQLSKEDKTSLRTLLIQMDAMRERILERLGDEVPLPTSSTFKTMASGTPETEEALHDDETDDDNAVVGKPDSTGPVTEPTPPSTVDHGEGTMELD